MTIVKLESGASLEIDDALYTFVQDAAVPGTGRTVDEVFKILGELVLEFDPKNQELLTKRVDRQSAIDEYYIAKRKAGWFPTVESAAQDAADIGRFLVDNGYLQPDDPGPFTMTTPELDLEMSQNGPELVTPVNNASMAVGGANARWGSLYDAYFLSDIHGEIDRDAKRDERLQMVVDRVNEFLDNHVAQWQNGIRFNELVAYSVSPDAQGTYELIGHAADGREAKLQNPERFVGFNQNGDQLTEFFLDDNGLKIQFQLYEGGKVDAENGQFKDVVVESAVTNIVDFEDAVAIVDGEDMVLGLRNYLGLIRGDLQAHSSRGALKTIDSDKTYLDVNGATRTAKGTSLMSVRNVSLHMYTDMVTVDGREISERMLGVLLTTLIATAHDNGSDGVGFGKTSGPSPVPVRGPNSAKGYVYQVTPKLQTSEEVAEQVRFFEAVEDKLGLAQGTVIIGIMNEELGMTLQLAEALRAAQSRVFFINTGFLDRTGSQIRVQTHAGPVDLRDDLTQAVFNTSYELHNVDTGIRTGVHQQGKIGKGMQVKNRAMAEMMEVKINHPRSGGNTAWVPAPNPSHLHSMHYHMIDVDEVQRVMEDSPSPENISRVDLLSFPLLDNGKLADPEVKRNLLLGYAHSMVAYVEPWVHRGIGCSGVPNFSQVEEMKDRATERIDGAIIANWKLHGVVSQREIEDAVTKAVEILDQQNSQLPGYVLMADTQEKRNGLLEEPAIRAVLEIIDDALSSPSAYVEPALFRNRKAVKAASK
ncbi:MAG: malate synthase G [Chloroflexi bacterium]|nr:malate synthase G [Chloroflexota bacterium]